MSSIISPDNTWALWTVLVVSAALSIFLEQRYRWAAKMTGCILAMLITMLLSNLKIIPLSSNVYESVTDYAVPLAVPMLLFNADLKKIRKESGRMILIFLMSSVGTFIGGIASFFAFREVVPNLKSIIPMFVGTYTGGSVNFVAMSETFHVDSSTVSAALIADNLLMALYFFLLISMPAISFIMNSYRHPYEDALNRNAEENGGKSLSATYWMPKEISLADIAVTAAISFSVACISIEISKFLAANFMNRGVTGILIEIIGNKYILMTTISMVLATRFSQFFKKLNGASEIGTFLIHIFFAVIGAPASIPLIVKGAPLLLGVAFVIVICNLFVSLLSAKIFDFSIEELIIASNANIGGPTTAASMAVSKGWNELIVPSILVGTLGYVVGNYFGLLIGRVL